MGKALGVEEKEARAEADRQIRAYEKSFRRMLVSKSRRTYFGAHEVDQEFASICREFDEEYGRGKWEVFQVNFPMLQDGFDGEQRVMVVVMAFVPAPEE